MPITAPPDMRVFDRTIARDHALYDGALVKVFGEYSNWSRSTLQAPPFTIDHFRHHTHEKLSAFLRQIPNEGPGEGIAQQDLSERRILLQHLAHCFVRLWGLDIHTHCGDVQEALRCLRVNLYEVIRTKKLPVIFEQNPLRSHHTAKYERTAQGMQPFIRMQEDDRALARFLAGPEPGIVGSPAANQHTLDLLREVQPFLTDTDETYIYRELHTLRQRLRAALTGSAALLPESQQRLLSLIMDDWETTYSSPEKTAEMDEIEKDLAAETGIAHILDQPPDAILQHCFSLPLAGNLDETTKAQLLKRRPILESLTHMALQRAEGGGEAVWRAQKKFFREAVVPTVQAYARALHLPLSDLGHLGLICVTHAEDTSVEDLLTRHLV